MSSRQRRISYPFVVCLLVTCGRAPTAKPGLGTQAEAFTLEGTWSGALNGKTVMLAIADETFVLALHTHHYEGSYTYDGAVLALNIKRYALAGQPADGSLCVGSVCAPREPELPATLSETLTLDVGPLLPNQPETPVELHR